MAINDHQWENNLPVVNLALLLLENNIENTFYNSMVGTNGDKCNPATFCRADIGLDFCQLCTRNATLYFSVCMARYSDKEVYGTLDIRNAIVASEVEIKIMDPNSY
ncbi:hypothetical protein LguiB_005841 [Lonicera macranthoides]